MPAIQTIKALLCCAWLACCAAHASDSQVIVEGSRHVGDAVRVGGHSVPLLHALEEVVPAHYSVNVPNAGPWADVSVSWDRGGSLVHVLGEILSVNPLLQAHIDTDLGLVTVTERARSPEDTASSQPAMPAAQPNSVAATTTAAAPLLPNAAAASPGGPIEPPLMQTQAAAAPIAAPMAAPSLPVSASPTALASTRLPARVAPSVPPAVMSPPSPPLPAAQAEWQLRISDGSVRQALARWAQEAGWQFVWDVPTDFAIDATATIHGTLAQALRQVVDALASSQVPIQVVMYERNRVLRVIAKGAS
ncbi:toxin co-regulated pilus biosynthesis Q family protein [Trinickia dinghuensis]|uniref:Toxin co-regulated pilus biosynthesis protein Q C-terminal domain-containing protein n=1 Tax=Trinickia dinghuensis TaxID=2291023 RepID=A0A3D8JWN6_9BURK|nr:toxin co-regulated pilus biosynthesis Q family protein [Trinickia dinghuensis]RDU96791.1 hypothetical protein DWV00_22490 [Trinickia dinghuensis]